MASTMTQQFGEKMTREVKELVEEMKRVRDRLVKRSDVELDLTSAKDIKDAFDEFAFGYGRLAKAGKLWATKTAELEARIEWATESERDLQYSHMGSQGRAESVVTDEREGRQAILHNGGCDGRVEQIQG